MTSFMSRVARDISSAVCYAECYSYTPPDSDGCVFSSRITHRLIAHTGILQ
jgi:hypothetical protein